MIEVNRFMSIYMKVNLLKKNIVKNNYSRKKWTQEDINKVVELKKSGKKLYYISLIFNVTKNAISKALQRHCTNYIKIRTSTNEIKNKINAYDSLDAAVTWANNNNLKIVKINKHYYINGNLHSIYELIFKINKLRLNKLLPIFRLNFFFENI